MTEEVTIPGLPFPVRISTPYEEVTLWRPSELNRRIIGCDHMRCDCGACVCPMCFTRLVWKRR